MIVAACQPPGRAIAQTFVQRGWRVIVVDRNAAGLDRIAALHPDRIETLALNNLSVIGTKVLRKAWGAEPIDMVINLSPLALPLEIRPHMRRLSTIVRCLGQGLAAREGSIISLVARPDELLSLNAQGLLGAMRAASRALGVAMAAKSVRVYVLSVSNDAPDSAVPTLVRMGGQPARDIASGYYDIKAVSDQTD